MADSNDVARKNAADWNAPGGGYAKWKQGDPKREEDLPVGGKVPMGATAGNYDNAQATANAVKEFKPMVPKDHPLQRLRSNRRQ